MKQITINIPDNCELKQDGNIYTVVEKENKLTYKDIVKRLFKNKRGFFIDKRANIIPDVFDMENYYDSNNCVSRNQAEKLLAINKLMNVAKYLNGDWQPDWKNDAEDKNYIIVNNDGNIWIHHDTIYNNAIVYFKSIGLAQQAIEILGEDTIKLALCTNY